MKKQSNRTAAGPHHAAPVSLGLRAPGPMRTVRSAAADRAEVGRPAVCRRSAYGGRTADFPAGRIATDRAAGRFGLWCFAGCIGGGCIRNECSVVCVDGACLGVCRLGAGRVAACRLDCRGGVGCPVGCLGADRLEGYFGCGGTVAEGRSRCCGGPKNDGGCGTGGARVPGEDGESGGDGNSAESRVSECGRKPGVCSETG